jgi:hypothetical protein
MTELEREVFDGDFRSGASTTTGKASTKGCVSTVVGGVPSTIGPELDQRQLSDRDAGELLWRTKSCWRVPLGVKGSEESCKCGDEEGDPICSRK